MVQRVAFMLQQEDIQTIVSVRSGQFYDMLVLIPTNTVFFHNGNIIVQQQCVSENAGLL